VPAARQVSLAPAGVRIRQWPARLASRGPAGYFGLALGESLASASWR